MKPKWKGLWGVSTGDKEVITHGTRSLQSFSRRVITRGFSSQKTKVTNNHENERKILQQLFEKEEIKTQEEMAKLKRKFLVERKLSNIINKYRGWVKTLSILYPEYDWSKFDRSKELKWNDIRKQKSFFDKIYIERNFQSLNDWYKITNADIRKLGGRRLLSIYNESLFKALKTTYPEHDWNHCNREHKAGGYWSSLDNQREFVNELFKKFKLSSLEDWHKVKAHQITDEGGKTLLNKYGNLYKCLKKIYPDYSWDVFRFTSKKRESVLHQDSSRFVFQIQKQYRIQMKKEWYRISNTQLRDYYGNFIVTSGGLISTLKKMYPNDHWPSPSHFMTKKSQQFLMYKLTQQIFTKEEVIEEYTHPLFISPAGGTLIFDLFIPSLNLAFEYQGEQHYQELYPFSPLEIYQDRDNSKLSFCDRLLIKLVIIPFWWDRSISSLFQSVHQSIYSHYCK